MNICFDYANIEKYSSKYLGSQEVKNSFPKNILSLEIKDLYVHTVFALKVVEVLQQKG